MTASFPTTLPAFNEPTNPAATPLGSSNGGTRTHPEHHRDLGDELLAVATKVGITSSADTTSHDYQLANSVVRKSLYDTNTVLAATTDNTPFAVTFPSGSGTHVLGKGDAGIIGALDMTALWFDMATLQGIPQAADIGFTPTGTVAATNVQAAIAEVASEAGAGGEPLLTAHLADTTDAHDASAISFSPTGTVAATDVQAAIAEAASESGAGGIAASLFDANTILKADTDNTPVALTVGTNTVVGREAGSITTIGKTQTGEASKLLQFDSSADTTLATGTYSTGNVVGGNIDNATSLKLAQTYTITQNATALPIGTPLYIDWNPTMAYAGDVLVGPGYGTGYFGPRAVVQLEGKAQYNNSTSVFGQAPIGYMDQLLVKNNPGSNVNYTPAFVFGEARLWAADNGTVTASKLSWAPSTYADSGGFGFFDNPVFFTANSGTLNLNAGGDYAYASFVSVPYMVGNVTLSHRIGYDVYDLEKYGAATMDATFGSKLSGATDDVSPTVTTQTGVRIPRLTYATNNYGIRCDTFVNLWGDTVTLTENADVAAFIGSLGSTTISTGSDNYATTFYDSHDWIVDTTLGAFAHNVGFWDTSTVKSGANTTNRDLKSTTSFWANPTFTADQSDDTLASVFAFRSAATFSTTGAGTPTLAVTDITAFYAPGPALGTGVTATNRRVLHIGDATGAGTLTNQYGVYIERLTKGATLNQGVRCDTPSVFYGDTATFTASALSAITMNGTYTHNFASLTVPAMLGHSATHKYQQDALNFGVALPAANVLGLGGTYENESATNNIDLRYISGVVVNPTVRSNTQAGTTLTQYTGLHVNPTLNVTGGGTLTATDVQAVRADGIVDTGVTLTTRTGYYVGDATGAGTITNQYGLDIVSLTKGATVNVGIRNASRTVYTPSTQNITAVGNAITPTATVHAFTATSSLTLTSAPTIADGVNGQILVLLNADTADTITIQDQGTLASSNLRLMTTTVALSPRDSVTLMYSSTVGDWVQITPLATVI